MDNAATVPATINATIWPGRNVVHVWSVDTALGSEHYDAGVRLLSADEHARAERLIPGDVRRRFVVVHGLLRRVLAAYLGGDPEAVAIAVGARGKPALAGGVANTGLVFNLSYSETIAVIAVGTGSEIGVDVERLGRDRDALAIAQRYFSRAEFDTLSQVPAVDHDRAFLTCWTRKEAAMKAHGGGMAVLGKIETGFKKAPQGVLIDLDNRRFTVCDLDGPARCICAVARAGEGFDVVQRNLD